MTTARSVLRTNVRQRIGDDASSNFFATTLIDALIDKRVRARAGEISKLAPNYYFEESSHTSVADTLDYNYVTTANLKMRSPIRLLQRYGDAAASYTYLEIRQCKVDEQRVSNRNAPLLALPDTLRNIGRSVSFHDTFFRVFPPPTDTSETYILQYHRAVDDAANDAALIDAPDEWMDYLALDVAVVLGQRKGDPRWRDWKEEMLDEKRSLRRQFRRSGTPGRVGPLERM